MAELLKMLSEVNGVSGNENAIRELILAQIKDKCDSVTVDTMGNIIALKKGKNAGRTIAVSANMDEVGFIISEITDKGYLKFKLVGDTDPRKLVSKRVVIGDGVKGVIGMKAIHLQTLDERNNVVKVKDLFIDIGAKDKDEAQRRVKLGTYGTYMTEYAKLNRNVKGKALGRSGACYALIKALEYDYPFDFYALFLAQHEVGARGAKIAAHRVNADAVLNISSADTADMYGCDSGGMRLGDGVTLSYMDKSTVADKPLTDSVIKLARENGINIQAKVLKPYSTDGGAVQLTDTRVVSAVIPCRYANSPVSVMNMGDIEATTVLIQLFLKKIGEMI